MSLLQWNRLFPGAALRVLQVGLAALGLGALGLADDEGAAAQVFSFVRFVFCQSNLLEGNFLFYLGSLLGGGVVSESCGYPRKNRASSSIPEGHDSAHCCNERGKIFTGLMNGSRHAVHKLAA